MDKPKIKSILKYFSMLLSIVFIVCVGISKGFDALIIIIAIILNAISIVLQIADDIIGRKD